MKNPPSVQETQVQSWVGIPFLDLLEKEMATTSVFLPRKSHGQRSLSGSSPWGQQRVEHCLATDHAHLFISSEKKKKIPTEALSSPKECLYHFTFPSAIYQQFSVQMLTKI